MTLQHTAPFLRLLLPFSIGIYAGLQLRTCASLPLANLSLLCCLLAIIAGLFCLRRLTQGAHIPSVFSHLLLLLGGIVTALSRYAPAHSDHYTRFKVPAEFLLHISEPPRNGVGFTKYQAEVKALIYPGFRRLCSGTLLLYITYDSVGKPGLPVYGDLIHVTGKLQDIPGAAYPEAFDYAAMMRERGIRQRIFVDEQFATKKGNSVNPLLALAHQAATWTACKLQKHFSRRIAAILASLLIGLRSDIETQDLEAFRNTGTLHVLAVSGMHIALIFQALMWLTGFLPAAFPRNTRLLLVALAIWTYACISGFSASVCRAAVMCSIMLLGKALRKDSSLANSLCASAFLLLLWEPRWLMDAGFLLSFTAVAGIIAFQPLVAPIWKPRNRLLLHIRDLLSVSCAAQLGTLPVSLYFFHQFATYFLIGNLVIIPLSSIALFGGLAFLALGSFAVIGPCVQAVTAYSTGLMLDIAAWIARLPNAMLEGCYQNIPEATALSFFLGGCAWYLSEFRSRKPWLLLSSLLLFIGLHSFRHVHEQYFREALIYSRKGKAWTLLFQKGEGAWVLSNDTSAKNRQSMQAYLQRYKLKPQLNLWKETLPWVQITTIDKSTAAREKHVSGRIWKASGMSEPANLPGFYLFNGYTKGNQQLRNISPDGQIILAGKAGSIFLHPDDTR